MVKPIGNKKYGLTIAILSCFIIGLFFVSFLIGRYSIHPRTVLDIILSNFIDIEAYWQDDLDLVVMQVRLPRIMLGILVGGALSVSGASYQTLLKIPWPRRIFWGYQQERVSVLPWPCYGIQAGGSTNICLCVWFNCCNCHLLDRKCFSRHEITVLILAGIVVSSFSGFVIHR